MSTAGRTSYPQHRLFDTVVLNWNASLVAHEESAESLRTVVVQLSPSSRLFRHDCVGHLTGTILAHIQMQITKMSFKIRSYPIFRQYVLRIKLFMDLYQLSDIFCFWALSVFKDLSLPSDLFRAATLRNIDRYWAVDAHIFKFQIESQNLDVERARVCLD